jgi:hypothetical protein
MGIVIGVDGIGFLQGIYKKCVWTCKNDCVFNNAQ